MNTMNNKFSVHSLFSAPTMHNERVLPANISDSVIAVLNLMDLYANKKYGVFSEDELKKEGLTFVRRAELRNKWYADENFIDGFLADNKNELELFQTMILQWKHRITGKFLVMKYFSEYALLQSLEDPSKFYAIRALTEDFTEMVPQKPPYVIQTTLLPFFNTIIWDGIVRMADIDVDAIAAKEITEIAKKVRKHNAAILSLVQIDAQENQIDEVQNENAESAEIK